MADWLLLGNVGVAIAILALTISSLRRGDRPRHARSWVFFGVASVVLLLHSVVSLTVRSADLPVSTATELAFTSLLAVGFVLLYGADQEEIARVERERARNAELATRDPLTSLYNMRAFRQLAAERIANARRHQGEGAVAIVDLDGFKALNDSQGHAAGDHILQLVATAARSTLRPYDVAARYGGDEFVVYLDRCDAGEAERVVNRWCTSVMKLSEAERAGVTLSAGVAAMPHDGTELDELLARADAVLLEIKRSGKNAVRRVGAA